MLCLQLSISKINQAQEYVHHKSCVVDALTYRQLSNEWCDDLQCEGGVITRRLSWYVRHFISWSRARVRCWRMACNEYHQVKVEVMSQCLYGKNTHLHTKLTWLHPSNSPISSACIRDLSVRAFNQNWKALKTLNMLHIKRDASGNLWLLL